MSQTQKNKQKLGLDWRIKAKGRCGGYKYDEDDGWRKMTDGWRLTEKNGKIGNPPLFLIILF